MDLAEARAVLGITEADEWEDVRAAYRRLIRESHPDRAGARTTRRAARLNEAYAVLRRARRAGVLTVEDAAGEAAPSTTSTPDAAPPGSGSGSPETEARPAPPRAGVALEGTDTVLLGVPPQVAFVWLLEAGHRLGAVSYVDRSCGIFEVIVRPDGETCSLLVTVEPRDHGSEAVLAVESLEQAASYSPEAFRSDLLAALR